MADNTPTEGPDFLNGTELDDLINGLGGNDSIYGLAGSDVLRGGSGNDTISGGPDTDFIFGGDGNDQLSGDDGNDNEFGDAGDDYVAGGDGNDHLVGGTGADWLRGDNGNDDLDGSEDVDGGVFLLAPGTAGSLRYSEIGTSGVFLVQLVQGNSVQTVFTVQRDNAGVVTVEGQGLAAGSGRDTLINIEQANFVVDYVTTAPPPNQSVTFNIGVWQWSISDLLFHVFGSVFADSIDLGALPGAADTITLNATGDYGNDVITGHNGKNFLGGDAGDDILAGLGGDDELNGGFGNDQLNGGSGRDIAYFTLDAGTTGTLRAEGTDDGAVLVKLVQPGGGAVALFRITASGQDTVQVQGLGAETVQGTDSLTEIEQLSFFVPNDGLPPTIALGLALVVEAPPVSGNFAEARGTIFGDVIDLPALYGAGADVVLNARGGLGNDSIVGHAGNNYLTGGDGNDTIKGGAGYDWLLGEAGNDALTGGSDVDTAQYVLPHDLAGSLRVVADPAPDAGGAMLVQLVQPGGQTETVLRLARDAAGVITVDGRNSGAAFGTDTLREIEYLFIQFDDGPNPLPGRFLNLDLTIDPAPIVNGMGNVNGSVFGDAIDLATFYPAADVANPLILLNAAGGPGNDTITGTTGSNFLVGDEGDDWISGGHGGFDWLQGNAGNDTLDGYDSEGHALYILPKGSVGSLTITEDSLTDGYLLHFDDGVLSDPLLRFWRHADLGTITVEGLNGAGAAFGTDTLRGMVYINFQVDNSPDAPLPTQQWQILTNFVRGAFFNHSASVQGSFFGDVIDLAGIYTLAGAADTLDAFGDHGNDVIMGHSGKNTLSGNLGNDTLLGFGGDDWLSGNEGSDSLSGGSGNDTLIGKGGADINDNGLSPDNDTIDGGDGFDIALTQLPGAWQGSLRVVEATPAGTLLVQRVMADATVEDLFSVTRDGPGALTVTGLGSAAHYGTDQVSAVERLDFIIGEGAPGQSVSIPLTVTFGFNGAFNAQVVNGTGFADAIDVATALVGVTTVTAAMNVLVNGNTGADTITGHAGTNFLFGNAGNDRLLGLGGDDLLNGGTGDDLLDGGAGIDLASYAATRTAANVVRNTDRTLTVTTSVDGTDTVRHVEQVKFADGLFSFTFGSGGAPVVANFNPAFGWASQDQYPRHVADVNGDGYADIVGFGTAGVLVSFGSAGGSFSGAAVMLADFGQNAGWATDNGFHRELADVNGDGRADILGFGFAGTLVSLARADGTFGAVTTGITDFGVNQGWANQNGFARTVGDVNGDGKADLVGFGFAGALVALGNGNGTFQPVKTAIANFGVNQGWTSDNTFHRAVADVNGDGRADLVGFGIAGTYVALAKADGTFADAQLVLQDFGTSQGWASNDSFSRLVADVNGDHIADIIGFGIAGTLVAFGKGDGTFTQAGLDVSDFGKNQGWSSDNTFHREVADINKDGLADIVGFGIAGVLTGINQGDFLV